MPTFAVLRNLFRSFSSARACDSRGIRLSLMCIPLLLLLLTALNTSFAADKSGIDSNAPLQHQAEIVLAQADNANADPAELYAANCAACHQPDGKGMSGAFPPLAGSDIIKKDPMYLLKATLLGLSGPMTPVQQSVK